jgi:hypothetical protein
MDDLSLPPLLAGFIGAFVGWLVAPDRDMAEDVWARSMARAVRPGRFPFAPLGRFDQATAFIALCVTFWLAWFLPLACAAKAGAGSAMVLAMLGANRWGPGWQPPPEGDRP